MSKQKIIRPFDGVHPKYLPGWNKMTYAQQNEMLTFYMQEKRIMNKKNKNEVSDKEYMEKL